MTDLTAQNNEPIQPNQPGLTVAAEIRAAYKEGMKSSHVRVREKLVSKLVAEEDSRRATAVSKVFDMVEATELEIRKTDKPKILGFDRDNKPVGVAVYDQEQLKKLKELNEKLAKYNNALKLALGQEVGDFSKVLELGA